MAKASNDKAKQSQTDAMDLEACLTLNSDTGIITPTEGYFEKTLEGQPFDLATVKAVQDHQIKVLAASYHAAGKIIRKHYDEHPDVDKDRLFHLQYDAGHHSQAIYMEPGKDVETTRFRDVTTYKEPSTSEITKTMGLLQEMFSDLNS